MKERMLLVMGAAALSCAVLASCGGNDHHGALPGTVTPPPPATKNLDTAAVLAIVRTQTSETADPFEVDNAAVAVTPVGDETSSPVTVNAT
jgi:hypothetical protein